MSSQHSSVLVVGGGMAGITAAVESAELGREVYLVEQAPSLGGRVASMKQYFPKLCPPYCGLEINYRRIKENPRITVHTLTDVEEITGSAGAFTARLRVRPRYVTGSHEIDDALVDSLASERPDAFNLGMGTTKALYRPHDMSFPE